MNSAVDLAIEQARRGYSVTVGAEDGDYSELLDKYGVRMCPASLRPTRVPRSISAIRNAVAGESIKLIHAHTPAALLLARAAVGFGRVPLVITIHNEFDPAKYLSILAHRIIAVSRNDASRISRWAGQDRVAVALNGVIGTARQQDVPPVCLARPAVLFVGGLNHRKGVDVLIRAFAAVLEYNPPERPTLYLVGDGPRRRAFERLAHRLGCECDIRFVGFRANVWSYLNAADVFVLPSRSEPFGLVVAEARESGCAIIGSDVGGIPEVLSGGKAGVLVPPGDTAALADALLNALKDDGLRHSLRQAARTDISWLSVSRMADDVEKAYLSIDRLLG